MSAVMGLTYLERAVGALEAARHDVPDLSGFQVAAISYVVALFLIRISRIPQQRTMFLPVFIW
jgi:hypothetical protein